MVQFWHQMSSFGSQSNKTLSCFIFSLSLSLIDLYHHFNDQSLFLHLQHNNPLLTGWPRNILYVGDFLFLSFSQLLLLLTLWSIAGGNVGSGDMKGYEVQYLSGKSDTPTINFSEGTSTIRLFNRPAFSGIFLGIMNNNRDPLVANRIAFKIFI